MSDSVRTQLKASASGQNMRKRQSPKRRKSKKQEPAQKQQPQIEEVSYETSTIEEHANVLFKPNPGPQTEFLAASEREVLYGGSAGGGKSYAMLADPLRYMGHPQFSGLLLRHTTEELRELIFKSQELYPKIWPGIKWSERKMQWTAPSGARLWMSYLDRDEDVLRYQGLAFSWIGFDELTQWATPYAWNYMRSRLRSTAPDLPIFMRATTNPGGRGHQWVKKMFIDPAPYNRRLMQPTLKQEKFFDTPMDIARQENLYLRDALSQQDFLITHTLRKQETTKPCFSRFQNSSVGSFLKAIGTSKKAQRLLSLIGDVHVVEPYRIPSNWVKFRACDYGYGSYTGVLWFAVAPDEQLIVYRELYVSKVLATDLADMILDLEAEDGNIKYGVLDSSLWHRRGDTGPSLAEQMIAKGCRWRPSDRSKGSRVAGKNEIHRRLQVDEFTEEPRLVFFDSCTNVISQLPAIPLDKKNPEDVDTKSEDHLYDALRYGIMSRPRFSIFDYDPHGQTIGGYASS